MTRRLKLTLGLLAAALAVTGLVLAADEPHPKAGSSATPVNQHVSGVYDGLGNAIDLQANAVPTATSGALPLKDAKIVQRGKDWWPYATTQLPPYNGVAQQVEDLRENQIQVNGVITLDLANMKSSMATVPKDLLLDATTAKNQTEGFYLVKIAGFSRTGDQVNALQAAGAQLGEYMNVNTYIARIPAGSVNAVKALPFVTYVGNYEPAYKISPRLGMEDIPVDEAIDAASGNQRPWLLQLTLHKGANLDEAIAALDSLGIVPEARNVVSNDEMTVVEVRSVPEAITLLSKIPGVKFIAEKTYPRLLASATSPATIPTLLQNNAVFTTSTALGWKLWNAGIDGTASSQIITMMDSGLNTNMEHFANDTVAAGTLGPAHRKVIGYDNFGGDLCVLNYTSTDGGHGTWTSQHAAGSISNMSTNPDTTHTPTNFYDVGIARGAKIYFQDIGTSSGSLSTPSDLTNSITTAEGKGSFVQNYSWGTSSPTYDPQTTTLDSALFANPNFVVTVAAGNNGTAGQGTIGSPSTSKNCIAVGGVDAAVPDKLFADCNWDGTSTCGGTNDLGSARGPVTGSGRIKPDIMTYVAFSAAVGGEKEAGNRPHAMCQSDVTKTVYWDFNNQQNFGGTSFAAPEAAGLAALVRDYFMQGFYPTGTATPANAITPTGALIKAVILASGEDLGTTASPSTSIAITKRYSNDVGYGRANVPGVLHIGAGAPFLWVQNGDTLGDGSTKTFFYNIQSNSVPLKVMMVYYDAAGNALQKDADLKVTIGANVYWGNNYSGGWSTTATTTRDHTNPTEGVFLDAAHGLPSSGTVQVDVIGFNDPGGMPYSLVVDGDVASAAVTQVTLDKGKYSCNSTINVSVTDTSATSPVQVTLVSKDNLSNVIDTQIVNCTGASGFFQGSIVANSGIIVSNGGTVTANYTGATPATSNISCQANLQDGGSIISGGCDNSAAGTDPVNGPLSNGGTNEFYTKYMDAGETSSYSFGFTNQTGAQLNDVYVTISFSGTGASKMSAFNTTVHVGRVPAGALAGAVFQVATDPTTTGLTPVNMNFDITSPADGFTSPTRITQVQLLQANDVISRRNRCSTFNSNITGFTDTAVGGHPLSGWKWSGSATTPSTVSSENRTDGICSSSTPNAAAMIGNSNITSGNNFTGNSDSVLATLFQPALTGNGPSGQPYHYAWKWHSFYHASETLNNTTGVWGIFYNDQWNSSTSPTGDQVMAFPINISYYYQTIFDYVGTWNWETANTGTPDNPNLTSTTVPIAAPNQLFITFNNVTGLATSSTWFAYGQEHADLLVFGGTSTATTRRDIAFDNDNLVYDEYYAAAQVATCGSTAAIGQVAFDQYSYNTCPSNTIGLSVVDQNAGASITVTVTSPGTGDSEVVTLNGPGPYYTGTLATSTQSGRGNNNGTLFVLPSESITASYTDTAPAGTSTASALIGCTGGAVVFVGGAQVSDNGDNDGFGDNNETVTMDLTIQNNLATALTNAKVTIFSNDANVDCIPDNQALYGTIAAGATATNPVSDRFTYHVSPTVQCTDPNNPPVASFTVIITGDGIDGSSTLQTYTVNLDVDINPNPVTFTQNFATNPGWTVNVTPPDNAGCTTHTYTNDFHWCALCGNAGGGYGAWVGNQAFGTSGQNYTAAYNSSTLYSPAFIANGNVTLQFQTVYRTEASFDGAIVQYKLNTGSWTNLGFTTPAQSATTASNFCSAILASTTAWTGTGTSVWTTTNAATVPSAAGQSVQFRWRLGGDVSGNGTTFGGFGVDNVTVTNLRQQLCETTRNTVVASNGGTICEGGTLNLSATFLSGATYSWTGPNGFTSSQQNPSIPNAPAAASGTYTVTVMVNGCSTLAGQATTNATVIANGSSCTDSNACTSGDVCSGGTCTGTPVNCDDNNFCTSDSCNPATGCVYTNNTNPCNDNNACTSGDVCGGGTCHPGAPIVCNDNNVCTDDSCNPATGCVYTNNTASCDDGNACTTGDVCGGGVCNPGGPTNCDDNNPCTDDSCNPLTGCVHTNNTNSCDDGNACTSGDTCGGGTCNGTPIVCNDNNVCTTDTCNPLTGCVYTNNTNSCDDGNACTSGDTCGGGTCHGTPIVCNDNNVCTDDSCNPFTGCVYTNNTASCDDGNACTTGDVCGGGTCNPGGPTNCDDSNPCTDDSCDPQTGCQHTNNTASCDDGNACTTGDTCSDGVCNPGGPTDCNDHNPCTDDSCDPQAGCQYTNNTASCDDGNACTTGDVCADGTCHAGTSIVCNDNNVCTTDSCDPQTGCVYTNNTNACDDGNACTAGDICGGGTCHAGAPVVCNDNNVCTDDSCNPVLGCVYTNNTASCDDGNACTTGDVCSGGLCQAGGPTNCDDNNPCTDDSCDPQTGCVHTNNTASCDDGNACTTGDTCGDGVCNPGGPTDCDDHNPCTDDSCDPQTGCQHTNNTASCDDGNACTTGDTCGGGTCNGTPIVCNDNNVCTTDSCNPATGCVYTPNNNSCDDGNACTAGDTCGGGVCHPGVPVVCNDNNVCTDDSCNPILGCVYTNNTASCDDGNPCTTGDTCGGGTCNPGGPTNCDDNNPCTDDSCDPQTGCVHTNNTASCDDGNACTTGDTCGDGVCNPGSPTVCNDNNVCTTDSCNPATGCVYTNNTNSCDDGSACTTGDTCSGGSCHGVPVICNDNNTCTTDSCNPATGCVYTNNTNSCDDGNPCTQGDTCSGGICFGVPVAPPDEVSGLQVNGTGGSSTVSWSMPTGGTRSDLLRGLLSAFPVGPGGADETCFDNLPGLSMGDPNVPPPGDGYWYLVRAESICGNGSWGYQESHGVVTYPRATATCP